MLWTLWFHFKPPALCQLTVWVRSADSADGHGDRQKPSMKHLPIYHTWTVLNGYRTRPHKITYGSHAGHVDLHYHQTRPPVGTVWGKPRVQLCGPLRKHVPPERVRHRQSHKILTVFSIFLPFCWSSTACHWIHTDPNTSYEVIVIHGYTL